VAARAKTLSRRPDALLGGVAALCLVLLMVVCAVGMGGAPQDPKVNYSNQPTAASDSIDVTKPVHVRLGSAQDPGDAFEVAAVEVSVLGIGLPTGRPMRPGDTAVTLRSLQYLVAGDVVATAAYSADNKQPQFADAVLHTRNGLLTLPGIGGVGLLLFSLAYTESLLRPVRRRQRTKASTLAGMALVGVAFGLALALVGWALFPGHLLNARLVFTAALLGNAAALALTVLLSRRDPELP
jgi:hypothetical protein